MALNSYSHLNSLVLVICFFSLLVKLKLRVKDLGHTPLLQVTTIQIKFSNVSKTLWHLRQFLQYMCLL